MKLMPPRWIGFGTALLLLLAVWVVVILVALHVSAVVLDTLQMIVDLAAMTP